MFQDLCEWIDTSLEGNLPEEIKGYCFNLIENGGLFSVELIGSSSFDEGDPDWPCDEIFEAPQRSIEIPTEVSGNNWEICLSSMSVIVQKYIKSSAPGALKLKRAQGVGIGFVDGDLCILTKP